MYVSIPKDGSKEEHIREGLKSVEEADCDVVTRTRVRDGGSIPGAIWHIYHPRDADKIRDMLNKVSDVFFGERFYRCLLLLFLLHLC